MASWIGVITNAGNSLMANWAGGSVINIDKAVAGTGVVSSVSLLAQTDLVGEKQNASIVSSKVENDNQKIKIQIGAPEEGYLLNQIGLFASLDGGDPVLLALFQNETGIPIPSVSESPDFLYTFHGILKVSNQGEFSCTVDSEAYVSQSTLEEYVTAHADPKGAAAAVQANLTAHNTNPEAHADLRASLEEVLGTITAALAQLDSHNADTEAHADIRAALQELSDWVKDLLDCDDETLNEMHEVVEYIKSNRSLIESITTSKVSVKDIVNDLITEATNKPLSAAQGVVLKALIDTMQGTISSLSSEKADENHTQAASTITAGTFAGQVVANASAVATVGTAQVRNIRAGTADLTAGSSSLATGELYLVYE